MGLGMVKKLHSTRESRQWPGWDISHDKLQRNSGYLIGGQNGGKLICMTPYNKRDVGIIWWWLVWSASKCARFLMDQSCLHHVAVKTHSYGAIFNKLSILQIEVVFLRVFFFFLLYHKVVFTTLCLRTIHIQPHTCLPCEKSYIRHGLGCNW